ncbi:hypothetical protein DSCO28_04040 [Desulfosarcina ovata subsp. sediminis]|uniref:Uncharacterized protein n=1 Tax=Desulfosarcina ovata subsp. sediminis TaxID=885957 RepID=A0A5K7ZCD9_9BACT|nr:hypothetical protein [Desulfosarcina ovata]BBO79838.1 hypothetical protein DSCO28_04040 [Desulfosarcina ovata subsp. sediminis]
MTENSPLVRVHVNIEISAAALQAVVANSKRKTGADESGRYRVDTADALADMISKFLQQKGFDDFARDPENY